MKSPSTSIPGNMPRPASGFTPLENAPRQAAGAPPPIRARGLVPRVSSLTGFTLMEVIMVIGIVTALALMGLAAGVDTYQRYLFWVDVDTLVVLLQKARSSAINNIGGASHGVYVCDPANFVLFRGASYGALPAHDLNVGKSKAVVITSCPGVREVVFSPLSGTTSGSVITASDGVRTAAITINHEGGINW